MAEPAIVHVMSGFHCLGTKHLPSAPTAVLKPKSMCVLLNVPCMFTSPTPSCPPVGAPSSPGVDTDGPKPPLHPVPHRDPVRHH